LTEANREQAQVVVERIRRSISAQPLDLDGKSVSMTISAGIANLSEDHETFDRLLRRADKALYRAKESGRNAVVMDDEIPRYFDEADTPLIILDSEE
jgi:diguanylate cyclase (GGDEF)-like protein